MPAALWNLLTGLKPDGAARAQHAAARREAAHRALRASPRRLGAVGADERSRPSTLAWSPGSEDDAEPRREWPTAATRPLRTFIVEDSPIIIDNLSASLEELAPVKVVGHAADETSAVQCLSALGADIDLVIIDIFLETGSGVGVLRSAQRCGLRARRAVLTSFATDDVRRTCALLGADRVFDKSTQIDDLIAYCTELAGA